jgi:hypothetical protein
MSEAAGMQPSEIADRLEIQAALYRYCRSLDRMDKPMAYALWSDGATAEYFGMYKGTGIGFVDWVWEGHAQMQRHSHQFTNILIEVDGDRAASEAYGTVVLWTKPDPDVIETTTRGRYLDTWSRNNGRWTIDTRLYVLDTMSRLVIPPEQAAGVPPEGRRDRDDPSYGVLPHGGADLRV